MTSHLSRAVVLLAGGLGTRLKGLFPDLPKPMVPVANKPFIEWVIRYFERQECDRFVVALGHQASVAEEYLRARSGSSHISITHEPSLLGTAGGIHVAAQAVRDVDMILAANADSLVLADLQPVYAQLQDPSVDAVLVGVEVPDTSRYGSLQIEGNRLCGFYEKRPGQGYINGGIYAFKPRLLDMFGTKRPLSMEHDVLPDLLRQQAQINVVKVNAPFLDIGTPESLTQGSHFIENYFLSSKAEMHSGEMT